ncbi:MAG: AsmA-like C-terminal domain-containing protein [Desulfuromonadales bacterium]|nr:AsmA-like C-terminal domain-containing protein [Desulfuromonadales bacterium]MBN2792043.1 AsmA-like C-terminal domain-containing protein [Desulfuromonadales bacterium]
MRSTTLRILIRTFYLSLIFCATLITLMIVFLSQLKLDDYRQSLENQLSSALQQPVTIGHSSLTYNQGLALELKELQIGSATAPLARVPRLVATLKLTPLLQRQFILDQVQIDNPELQLHFPLPQRAEKGTSQRLFNTLGISILTIHNARVKIYQDGKNDMLERLRVNNLHAVLTGWQAGQSGRLVVSAQLPDYQANLFLDTKLPTSADPDVWRREVHQTELRLSGFSTAGLPRIKGQSYPQALDLHLSIQGAPANGTVFNAQLSGAPGQEKLFALSGRWTSTQDQDAITALKGEMLSVPLQGEFYYLRQVEKNYIAGRFGAMNTQLSPQLLKTWRIPKAERLLKGELERLSLSAEKSWPANENFSGLPRIAAEITLCNLDWDIPEIKQLHDFSVDLVLDNNRLSIQDGVIVAGGQPVDFSGRVDSPFLKPEITLSVQSSPQLELFTQSFPELRKWGLFGPVAGNLKLTGPLHHPDFSLIADFTEARLQHTSILTKPSGTPAKFSAQGKLAARSLLVDHFTLELPNIDLTGSGRYQATEDHPEYQLKLDPLRLQQLTPFSPLLKRLHSKGEVTASLSSNHEGPRGIIDVDNVEAHLTSIIGELRQTTGRIEINRQGFNFHDLKASLGESVFQVNGRFTDWNKPHLKLDIQGTNIRAHDLIFSNPDLTLHDLDGHLEIDAERLRFSPVRVRLEDRTVATVYGSVNDFKNPSVSLDIRSDQVDVLDVIKLFQGGNPPDKSSKRQKSTPVHIKVSAKQGTLGGLHFKNAQGVISDHNKLFTIYPLSFDNGDGWCQARVEFDRSEQTAPLKISGHVEGINASVLHQDLFAEQGLINGSLRGDFYIAGDPVEENFWGTARGGLHLQVSDGTLRKFHGLAKVFSLLNISQIFSGQLPDMDREGMPFSLMEGSVNIAAGQLTTEDFKVTSEAMNLSLVGTQGLVDDKLDFTLGVKPLRTVDKVITKIPIAGWILAGEEEALVTAYFKVEGSKKDPKVTPIPIDSVSKTVFGIFKRTLGLPGKLVKDIGTLLQGEPEKKEESTEP